MASKYWSDEEIRYLIDNYESCGLIACADYLQRSQSAVLHKASKLGLKRKGRGRHTRVVMCSGYLAVSEYGNRYQIHRRVMEEKLGRKLEPWEIVHHIDGNKLNNSPENLELTNRSDHQGILHREDLENRRDKKTGKLLSLRDSLDLHENEV